MKYVLLLLLSIGFLLSHIHSAAAAVGNDALEKQETDEENCALVENARERLACYDRTFPRGTPAPLPAARTEVTAPPPTLSSESANSVDQSQSATDTTDTTSAVDDTAGLRARRGTLAAPANDQRSKGMFAWADDLDFTAKVDAVRDKGQQRMVFLLDNEQLWMQSSPRFVPIKKGDTVRVKSGKIGGYIMRNQNDVSTRVHRIK